jgi:hypothetical protein
MCHGMAMHACCGLQHTNLLQRHSLEAHNFSGFDAMTRCSMHIEQVQ